MRNTLCHLATASTLRAGAPTGLTGLPTHPSPRPRLLYLYTATLHKLSQLPAHSAYRRSAEALTTHRLRAVEAVKPAGYDAWAARAADFLAANPRAFADAKRRQREHGHFVRGDVADRGFVWQQLVLTRRGQADVEWGGDGGEAELEGTRAEGERDFSNIGDLEDTELVEKEKEWVPEPPLEAKQ